MNLGEVNAGGLRVAGYHDSGACCMICDRVVPEWLVIFWSDSRGGKPRQRGMTVCPDCIGKALDAAYWAGFDAKLAARKAGAH